MRPVWACTPRDTISLASRKVREGQSLNPMPQLLVLCQLQGERGSELESHATAVGLVPGKDYKAWDSHGFV